MIDRSDAVKGPVEAQPVGGEEDPGVDGVNVSQVDPLEKCRFDESKRIVADLKCRRGKVDQGHSPIDYSSEKKSVN